MITAAEASRRVLEQVRSYGTEKVILEEACGRVLTEDVVADRDIPPYNRATMDGIAVNYMDFAARIRQFEILAVQAAGDEPLNNIPSGSCVQIMTGAAMPDLLDTVIPVEELVISDGKASVSTSTIVEAGQFVHKRGADKQKGDVLIGSSKILSPADIPIAATVGMSELTVSRLPRVVVVTTGDELVGIKDEPSPYQVRRSNNYAVQATLAQYAVKTDMIHLADDPAMLGKELERCLEVYDVIIISGGVSKGEFDYIPSVLDELSVDMIFHGVKQKPGKPLWFGTKDDGPVVFALPGNPVSTFLCLNKYVLPWLACSLGAKPRPMQYAVLQQDIDFTPALDYFLQASLSTDKNGQLVATPLSHNGSGDFINLSRADAFIELPADSVSFKSGEPCRVLLLGQVL